MSGRDDSSSDLAKGEVAVQTADLLDELVVAERVALRYLLGSLGILGFMAVFALLAVALGPPGFYIAALGLLALPFTLRRGLAKRRRIGEIRAELEAMGVEYEALLIEWRVDAP